MYSYHYYDTFREVSVGEGMSVLKLALKDYARNKMAESERKFYRES